MNSKTQSVSKGGFAEEALREYFAQNGAFVLRGLPVRSMNEDVTDIDLWVYARPSAYSRHVSIVDIKYKKRGKPFDRTIWVKGLQTALAADEAILATQGAKKAVYEFASKMDVRVLSGPVFDAVLKRYSVGQDRIAAEDLDIEWKKTNISQQNLKAIIDDAKSQISTGVDFATLNAWIDQAAEFLKLAVERERRAGPIIRAAYLMCSLVAIGADYLGRDQALADTSQRRDHFRSGLLFGNMQGASGDSYLDFAESVVTEYSDPTGATAAQIRTGFERAVAAMPVDGLIEFFSKISSSAQLYKGAVRLEAACHAKDVLHPSELESVEAKVIIGLLSDYAGIARRDILGEKKVAIDFENGDDQGKLPL